MVSHSQTTITRQPIFSRAASFAASLSTLRRNFCAQYSERDFGMCATLHPWCWCQKHPCTKIATLREGNTRSGLPGRECRWSRYLNPALWSMRRTNHSGFVSFPRILRIRSLRSCAVSVSAIFTPNFAKTSDCLDFSPHSLVEIVGPI